MLNTVWATLAWQVAATSENHITKSCVSVQDFVSRRTVQNLFWVGLSDWRTGRWEWVNQTPYVMDRR